MSSQMFRVFVSAALASDTLLVDYLDVGQGDGGYSLRGGDDMLAFVSGDPVAPDAATACPDAFPVKAWSEAGISLYATSEQSSYSAAAPTVCYADGNDAIAAGYTAR